MSNIILLGLVSLLVDMSSEMVYPLTPLYLTSVLGATPVIVGLIEGIAESIASLLKVFSGYISDKYRNKKLLTFIGYSTSIIYKVLLIFSTTWPGILFARIIDRMGKGIRVAPRDSLIAESSDKKKLGGSFGLHKMLDMLGAAAGILISYFLLTGESFSYTLVFTLSIIPAILGVFTISFVKEGKREGKSSKKLNFNFTSLDKRLKLFLIIVFIFNLGNSSNAFLLLRAQNVGYSAKDVILLYFLFTIVASILAYPLGKLSDKLGRRVLLVTGYLFYGVVYIGFATLSSKVAMILLFTLYGIYTALTAGAERALITEISPPELKGTMLGAYATLVGLALLPASLIAGVLWNAYNAATPFYFGGTLGLTASVAIGILLSSSPKKQVKN